MLRNYAPIQRVLSHNTVLLLKRVHTEAILKQHSISYSVAKLV